MSGLGGKLTLAEEPDRQRHVRRDIDEIQVAGFNDPPKSARHCFAFFPRLHSHDAWGTLPIAFDHLTGLRIICPQLRGRLALAWGGYPRPDDRFSLAQLLGDDIDCLLVGYHVGRLRGLLLRRKGRGR